MKPQHQLNRQDLIELLNKCWMTHDGMWFYHCLQQLGIKAANKLNKAAIKSLAPIEIARIKKALGIEKEIETFAEFKYFFEGTSQLFMANFMNISVSFPHNKVLHWAFAPQKCFAYKGMRNMGVIAEYDCGVIYRLECWIASLGIKYAVHPQIKKCLMLANGRCCGDIRLDLK
jgi:hypothetical protein